MQSKRRFTLIWLILAVRQPAPRWNRDATHLDESNLPRVTIADAALHLE